MQETTRHQNAKPLFSQHLLFHCTFEKYGKIAGSTERSTLLSNIRVPDTTEVIDHVWVDSKELSNAKLRTGQAIVINGTFRPRKRATIDSSEIILDVKLTKVKFLRKASK